VLGKMRDRTSSPLNFPFKIVASMILYIIFFTVHLVTWSLGHLVTWSLGHLVTWSLGHLVTWSLVHLVTCSLGHLVTWLLGHLVTGHLVTGHLVINLFGRAHNNYAKFHYNRISSLRIEDKQTNKHTCFYYHRIPTLGSGGLKNEIGYVTHQSIGNFIYMKKIYTFRGPKGKNWPQSLNMEFEFQN
jgi:hypothetical protein